MLEGPERQYDPHDLAWDMMSMAAMVAGATKKIRVGHLVLCNLFRHPAITAQSLMTLDHLSNGRLLAGLGSGWTETEFRMTGIPFPPIAERLRMLDEALTCIKSLWTKEQSNFDGEFYHLKDAILWPKPIQKPCPPIIVGGGGKGSAAHRGEARRLRQPESRRRQARTHLARTGEAAHRRVVSGENPFHSRRSQKRVGRDPNAIRISSFIFASR